MSIVNTLHDTVDVNYRPDAHLGSATRGAIARKTAFGANAPFGPYPGFHAHISQ